MENLPADRKFKLLIVDDVPKNIQILGNILKDSNLLISYALSGREAIQMTDEQDFDLILLDIMMPGMNGFDVCIQLKRNSKTSNIPIVFLTAKADKDSVVKGFKLGAEDYVTKPFNSEELMARVKTHLALKSQREKLQTVNKTLEDKVASRTAQLRAANKQLLSLEKAKSDFLNIISHELRTPLNGLQGLIELLEDTDKSREQQEYIEYLKEASSRLVKFSETAILITTLRADKYKISYSPLKIAYLIDDLIDEFEEQIREKSIKVVCSIVPEDLQIRIDADLIKNSFASILDNAIRYCKTNGKISINAKILNNKPVVQFIDDGPGFKKVLLDKLFKYFTSTDSMNSEGLGLSIAAVKLIMDAHHGQVRIENSQQGGAIVTLEFPE
jgi:two-component system sensor histidine kinase/response regulator